MDPLVQKFRNLKSLSLCHGDRRTRNLKSVLLPKLQDVNLNVICQSFLPDFIRNNGENFKSLTLYYGMTTTTDEYLREIVESVGEHCQNLQLLSVTYDQAMSQQLSQIFSNCNQLKSIAFSSRSNYNNIDGDRILTILNQILPKNLDTISFEGDVVLSGDSFENLISSWEGPRPINISLSSYQYNKYHSLLTKYQNFWVGKHHLIQSS